MATLSFSKKIPPSVKLNPLAKSSLLKAKERLTKESLKKGGWAGWLDWPQKISSAEIREIKDLASQIRKKSDAFVLLGVGGSYLGARAGIEALASWPEKERLDYAGHNLSSLYFQEVLEKIGNKKRIYVNVVSRSGTTLETRLAWSIFKQELKKRQRKNFGQFVIVTTLPGSDLDKEARRQGYKTFFIPSDIGGRYSVLTAVGLLPMAVAGIEIEEVIKGAKFARQKFWVDFNAFGPVAEYVLARRSLYKNGLASEALAIYHPRFFYLGEWWKQLFAESEGKGRRGIFPTTFNFTQDLHSLGQYIQEGRRLFWELILDIEKQEKLPSFSRGRALEKTNQAVQKAVEKAHFSAGVPQLKITLPSFNAFYLGQLFYFWELSCALSAYMSRVNPFDQPGVEAYKKEIRKLL